MPKTKATNQDVVDRVLKNNGYADFKGWSYISMDKYKQMFYEANAITKELSAIEFMWCYLVHFYQLTGPDHKSYRQTLVIATADIMNNNYDKGSEWY